ncbi:MAG TPA: GNAT family N-acetyltransferase [Candidatus Binatia bacterium]|nr:GNAT family N-acetyltransferase [Candidatus Binatia bacterium]
MKVRRLEPGEAALLKDLRLRALAEAPTAFAHTHAEISARPDSYWEEMTRGLTEPGLHVMFVAEAEGRAIGMAFGVLQRERPDVPHVGGMWVDPAARAGGVGSALTAAVLDWARERGFQRIGLWVTEGNAAAIALYERMGFTPTGRRDRQPVAPDLGILEMERAL